MVWVEVPDQGTGLQLQLQLGSSELVVSPLLLTHTNILQIPYEVLPLMQIIQVEQIGLGRVHAGEV